MTTTETTTERARCLSAALQSLADDLPDIDDPEDGAIALELAGDALRCGVSLPAALATWLHLAGQSHERMAAWCGDYTVELDAVVPPTDDGIAETCHTLDRVDTVLWAVRQTPWYQAHAGTARSFATLRDAYIRVVLALASVTTQGDAVRLLDVRAEEVPLRFSWTRYLPPAVVFHEGEAPIGRPHAYELPDGTELDYVLTEERGPWVAYAEPAWARLHVYLSAAYRPDGDGSYQPLDPATGVALLREHWDAISESLALA